MASPQLTNKDKVNMWKERCTTTCSCNEDMVVYFCNDDQCPNNKTDPLFCIHCFAANEKHKHVKPPLIYDKLIDLDSAWNIQKERANKIRAAATQRYSELETLVHYFEHEMLIV